MRGQSDQQWLPGTSKISLILGSAMCMQWAGLHLEISLGYAQILPFEWGAVMSNDLCFGEIKCLEVSASKADGNETVI